jgi:hypothetical protein
MYQIKPILFNYVKKGFIALILFVGLSQLALAVDGIIIKSKSSKTSFSNMKKNLTLTLHSGFSYHDNKSFGFNKIEKNRSFNSIISFQKGNVTYILPYKNKTLLQKFKTPQKPASH